MSSTLCSLRYKIGTVILINNMLRFIRVEMRVWSSNRVMYYTYSLKIVGLVYTFPKRIPRYGNYPFRETQAIQAACITLNAFFF